MKLALVYEFQPGCIMGGMLGRVGIFVGKVSRVSVNVAVGTGVSLSGIDRVLVGEGVTGSSDGEMIVATEVDCGS